MVKNYKVIVKVSGKASKKFTAKTSKKSVATVKVRGNKIAVTAKKEGTVKITVTTREKGAKGKKLRAYLKLTVKKKKASAVVEPASIKKYYSINDIELNFCSFVDGYTIENIRDYVVGLNTPVELADGTMQPLINFDNAATTPVLKAVQDTINEELEMYGSIGRGYSQKSNHSTDVYNSVRDKVLEFFTADPEFYTCFYVNSTTDGLNKLASALIKSEDDIVLTTRIEHHANDLSWRERCKAIDILSTIGMDKIEAHEKTKEQHCCS